MISLGTLIQKSKLSIYHHSDSYWDYSNFNPLHQVRNVLCLCVWGFLWGLFFSSVLINPQIALKLKWNHLFSCCHRIFTHQAFLYLGIALAIIEFVFMSQVFACRDLYMLGDNYSVKGLFFMVRFPLLVPNYFMIKLHFKDNRITLIWYEAAWIKVTFRDAILSVSSELQLVLTGSPVFGIPWQFFNQIFGLFIVATALPLKLSNRESIL